MQRKGEVRVCIHFRTNSSMHFEPTVNHFWFCSFFKKYDEHHVACGVVTASSSAPAGDVIMQVAVILGELGRCIRDDQRPKEAEAFFARALEIREAALGPDHVKVCFEAVYCVLDTMYRQSRLGSLVLSQGGVGAPQHMHGSHGLDAK